ncbi:hypothetical protein BDA96_08G147600 [Sorghum bicolor]|uniref:Uncharacterized protein n=2 Tax=Sorghum bicolor TaxID=4558 RepID=A0A921U7J6_SORBI|nr:hypothetical protein BDA96_08G147600 [Sorghum bicolor]KXG23737.1 hypothetical protein SORBI_3008G133800 [Sorghum bicolor]
MAGKSTILALFTWAMTLLLIFMTAHVLLYGNLGCRPVSGPTPLLLTSVQFAYDWAVSLTFSLGPITNCEAARVWDQVVQTRLATFRRYSPPVRT